MLCLLPPIQANLHLPAYSYDTKHHYIHKCFVDIKSWTKTQKWGRKYSFLISSSKSRCSTLRNRSTLAVKNKTLNHNCFVFGDGATERVNTGLLFLNSQGFSRYFVFYAQNSSMLKKIKPSFWNVLTDLFQRWVQQKYKHWTISSHWKWKISNFDLQESRALLFTVICYSQK